MPSYRRYSDSRYLRKEAIDEPQEVTISEVREQNVAPDGERPKLRLVASFYELAKPLVLNMTNCEVVANIVGTDDFAQWANTTVEIYVDPTVKFGTERRGGIRIRPVSKRSTSAVAETGLRPVPELRPETKPVPDRY